MTDLRELIADRIRTSGPISFAEFMEIALYHPELGYYARATRNTGRAGDFFTSVDVGPIFGELLARQLGEMWRILAGGRPPVSEQRAEGKGKQQLPGSDPRTVRGSAPGTFELVEAGASDGRLSRDILDAAQRTDPEFYSAIRLFLVERSPAARAVQRDTLGPHAAKLQYSDISMPQGIGGCVIANELLDALPTHVVVMTQAGLREVFVDIDDRAEVAQAFVDIDDRAEVAQAFVDTDGRAEVAQAFVNIDDRAEVAQAFRPVGVHFVERLEEPSTPRLAEYLARAGATMHHGARAEVNLAAEDWMKNAGEALQRGFMIIIDYGHDEAQLYNGSHAAGTLTSFKQHTQLADMLQMPGECDITAHVDLTAVTRAAEGAGLQVLGRLDQTYFLLGLGMGDLENLTLQQRLAMKTLLLPGGLGSTHKVLLFGKGVGTPKLKGLSYRVRLT